MFRKMRRAAQELSEAECAEILKKGDDGVLTVLGDDDYPYGVPINYFYDDGKIYLHCAKSGHKIDAVKRHDKVSFCVIDKHKVLPELYATEYSSVIAFGRASIMDNADRMREAVRRLALKFCLGDEDGVDAEIEKDFSALAMIEITIEHMTGKRSKRF